MSFNKNLEWFWPSITDAISAKKASKHGVWACTWCAAATLLFVVLSIFEISLSNFDISASFDAFLFILIGWGIFKMNRVAAVAGLVLYILERAYMWSEYGSKNPAIAIIVTLMFINSIRGIFLYHKYAQQ
jgi:hypothetical protein